MQNLKYKKLSVILPTFNSGGKVINTLKSLAEQVLDSHYAYEVLVIDNNSTDNTKAVVENFMKIYPGIFLYHFQPQQGKGNALNLGISKANGEVMVVTDDDCVVDHRWIQIILDTFNTKDIDILTGKMMAVFQEPPPRWLDVNLIHGPFCNVNAGDEYFENDEKRLSYAGANMAFTKDGVKKFGNFSLLFGRGEDVVFFEHWVKSGARFGYAPNVIVNHINYPNRVTKDYVKKWYFLAGTGQGGVIKHQEDMHQRKLFGVPFWIYKKMTVNTLNCLRFYFTQPERSYFHRTKMYHCSGVFSAIWGTKNSKNRKDINLR